MVGCQYSFSNLSCSEPFSWQQCESTHVTYPAFSQFVLNAACRAAQTDFIMVSVVF